jgi:predicted ArsR family transcriptional regulator
MPESSNKGGRKPRVTDEDLLDVFRTTSDPVLSTAEVADAVPIKRRGTLNRLQSLEDDGDLESKQIGGRNTVWWLLEEQDVPRAEERPPATDELQSDDVKGDIETSLDEDLPDEHTGALEDVVDAVGEDTLPGSGAKLEARREALHAAVEYLREHGQATPSDFQTDVYPDHTGRYTEGDDPAYSWWTNCIYKGLRELAERTEDVEKADTTGEWSYRGEA